MSLLHIKNLDLSFKLLTKQVDVLHGINLKIPVGKKVALVGESGSGKSVIARIILGLLQETRNTRISGTVLFDGQNINTMPPRHRAELRGTEISMIFQDPTSSMNPMFTIGKQFSEVLRRRDPKLPKFDSQSRIMSLLDEVGIHDPERVRQAYPFQLSGGMNQRVMIAMALANKPKLLLADEPGTALDVSVQAQTLSLMRDMVIQNGTSVLFISHNLGVVREFADHIYVIYRGKIVEDGPTDALFLNPKHAYTRALMSAVPRITGVGLPEVPEISNEFLASPVSHGDIL